jgi:hypothetical protein
MNWTNVFCFILGVILTDCFMLYFKPWVKKFSNTSKMPKKTFRLTSKNFF